MKAIDKACLNKVRFDSKEACEESIKRSGKKFLRAYECPHCKYWHKTSRLSIPGPSGEQVGP